MIDGHVVETIQTSFAAAGLVISAWGTLVTWKTWQNCCTDETTTEDDKLNAWSMFRTEVFNGSIQLSFLLTGVHAMFHDPTVPHTPQAVFARGVITFAAFQLTLKSLLNRLDWDRILGNSLKLKVEGQKRKNGKIRTRAGDTQS